ncbi:MAG TPA: alpha/beta hydrolase-fold protein [Longimicrobiales bacterium]|nr:alpha/beta hydrolase-fold protein [Longimicrobiales bacterium]
MTEWVDYPSAGDGHGHTVAGTVKVLPALRSPQLGNERDILVYLPPSYAAGERHYPVVYMHDGQNLFDAATSFAGEWAVDQTLEAAGREAGLEAIVVGVPNMGAERLAEYSPFPDARLGGGRGEAYLDFIVETVKPLVDAAFRTQPSRATTGIAGSSMGALISLYGFFRRPETFGFVGAMSPAFWFGGHAIFGHVRRAPYAAGRVYLDAGTQEGPAVLRDARRMHDLLRQKGYRPGRELLYVEESGAGHNEAAWAGRLRRELEFLLGG